MKYNLRVKASGKENFVESRDYKTKQKAITDCSFIQKKIERKMSVLLARSLVNM